MKIFLSALVSMLAVRTQERDAGGHHHQPSTGSATWPQAMARQDRGDQVTACRLSLADQG